MDSLLLHLFGLAQSARQTQLEDFLSRCVGHYLESNKGFAEQVFKVLAEENSGQHTSILEDWLQAEQRSLEVRPQYPVCQSDYRRGWIDLLLDVRVGNQHLQVIIEAKVGTAVPTKSQIGKYQEATRADRVIALVRAGLTVPVEDVWVLTWDQVWEAARGRAVDLERLLARSGEITLMKTVSGEMLSASQALRAGVEQEVSMLARALLPWFLSVPDTAVWKKVSRRLEKYEDDGTPTVGAGAGYWYKKPIKHTHFRGLTLALVPSADGRFLSWRLEVQPTKRGRRYLQNRRDLRWAVVRQYPNWLEAEIARWSADGAPTTADLEQLVLDGRNALSSLRAGHPRRTFDPTAQPLPDYASWRLTELAVGIATVDQVEAALKDLIDRVVQRLAGGATTANTSKKGLSAFVYTDDVRLRVRIHEHFEALELVDEWGTRGLKRRWKRQRRDTGTAVAFRVIKPDGDTARCCVALNEHTWADAAAVEELLVSLGRIALEN